MTGSRFLPLFAGFVCLGAGLFSTIARGDDPVVFRSDVASELFFRRCSLAEHPVAMCFPPSRMIQVS